MSFKFVSSSSPKYLASADVLIGDMSDINYEFLLFNRPVILLANTWLKENFPDIGIKTDHPGLLKSVDRSLNKPDEFSINRKTWLNKTYNFPKDKSASRFILDIAVEKSGFKSPKIVLLHGNNITRKSNLKPIFDEAIKGGLDIHLTSKPEESTNKSEVIYIAAHFDDLNVENGYKVHLDHGLKGKGTANIEISKADYKKHNYFPTIDLHITAGKAGYDRTVNHLLIQNSDRVVIGAYPKMDSLLSFNTAEIRNQVCKELGFERKKPIIIYAPAGMLSIAKPGGSLSFKTIFYIYLINLRRDYNFIIKLKNKRHSLLLIPIKYILDLVKKIYINLFQKDQERGLSSNLK
jgi:CDP-glycerol glycerophosphotransferase (TagB/SpsB family)